MSILVVGSVAFDSVKTPFGKEDKILGGSATFFSLAASFFTKVNVVATVGEDFPRKYIDMLRGCGIGLDGLTVSKGKTFHWKGYYDFDLNTAHTISTHLNVFKDFNPIIPENLRNSKIVFLANIDPDLQLRVLKQMKCPKLVAMDTMNYWISSKSKSLKKILHNVDIFLLNDAEARQFSGESNLIKAAQSVIACGPKAVIIKRGEYGVSYFSKHSHFVAPAYLLESIYDPTGAGDTFAGGLMGYLCRGGNINESSIRKGIIYGSVLASFTVEDFSVNRLRRIKMKDIRARYEHFKKITRF